MQHFNNCNKNQMNDKITKVEDIKDTQYLICKQSFYEHRFVFFFKTNPLICLGFKRNDVFACVSSCQYIVCL